MFPKLAILIVSFLAVPGVWAQGPPYQTDDPVPVDYGHYEFYVFGSADGTPVEMDTTGPAVESSVSAVSWAAIIAGAIVAVCVSLILFAAMRAKPPCAGASRFPLTSS